MNIKDVERITGLKKANIRYYEQEGLLQPKRNRQNNYREYDQQNIETLERIKLLRLLEVPVCQIRALQRGETTFHEVMDLQEKKFTEEIKEKKELLEICKLVKMSNSNFEGLTITEPEGNGKYWSRMNGKILRQDRIRRIEANMVLVKNALPLLMLSYWIVWTACQIGDHQFPAEFTVFYIVLTLAVFCFWCLLRLKVSREKCACMNKTESTE